MANNVTDGSAISTGAARLAEAASNAAAKGKELTSTGTAKLDEAASNAAAKIDEAAKNAVARIDEAALNAALKLNEAISNAADKHVEVANDAATNIGEAVRSATAKFDEVARDAAAKHDETASNTTAKNIEAITNMAAMAAKLYEVTRNASANHDEAAGNAAAKLAEVTGTVTARLDEAAKNAAANSDEVIDDTKKSLRKVKGLLHVGKRCMVHADLTKANNLYKEGKEYYLSNDLIKSSNKFDEAENEIIEKLNEERSNKPFGISGTWIAFMVSAYGYIPLAISVAFGSIFAGLLMTYFTDLSKAPTLMGVPLWAALFAGIGACIQIIMNLVGDIKNDGVVSEHRQLWFAALPLIALVFGYLAYILIDLGVMTLAGPQSTSTATVGTQSLLPLGIGSKILICFLAGYATDDFIKKLTSTTTKI